MVVVMYNWKKRQQLAGLVASHVTEVRVESLIATAISFHSAFTRIPLSNFPAVPAFVVH